MKLLKNLTTKAIWQNHSDSMPVCVAIGMAVYLKAVCWQAVCWNASGLRVSLSKHTAATTLTSVIVVRVRSMIT